MQSKFFVAGVLAAAALAASASAGASVVYDNESASADDSDCTFSTTCAALASRGDDFAAQLFTLGSATTITGGSFVSLDYPANPVTSVNYAFYADIGGLPGGPALYSGSGATTDTTIANNGFFVDKSSFSIAPATLAAGSYFFAVQAVSPQFLTFLEEGAVDSGAAETHDGGVTWSLGYEGIGGVGVALTNGGVPEPAAWALLLTGFGLVGFAARRRSARALAA